ncbi:hypothetical protein NQK81_13610 [Amycolatopsis roodepoortensis]|uniref:hypothetical protein n=1 Tax=Amycolatopsis roodepoortensis TaxID=700274 RepID=UPI000F899519|nr:hypothetical protein [Amycolatopsis roodepoortensis]RSN26679.1 hypothetical protein DMC63_02280 [Streptomyces sp. WAC 05977]UUV34440.1 hypothetical protein NQK81_13610 [Amycolatopsis roodepoortensis]
MSVDMDISTVNRIGAQLVAIGDDMEREWGKFRRTIETERAGIGVDPLGTAFLGEYRPSEVSVLSHADPLPALWQADGHGARISAATYAQADRDAAAGLGK